MIDSDKAMSSCGPEENKVQLSAWTVTCGYAAVKALSVPPLQWISIISTNQKNRVANLQSPLSFAAMGDELVGKEGKRVLLKATWTSMGREFIKGLWKVPFQTGAESYAKRIVDAVNPNWQGKDRDVIQGLMAGIGAGTADALAASPLERTKIYIMTCGKPMGYWGAVFEIYGQHKHKPTFGRLTGFINEMCLKGIGASIVKQSAQSATVAIMRPWANSLFAPYKQDNPKTTAFLSAFTTGVCVAMIAAIPDLKKIKDQSSIGGKTENIFTFLKSVYAKNGLKAFSGVPGTIALTTFGYTLYTAALNIFDEYVKKDNGKSLPPSSGAGQSMSTVIPSQIISNNNDNSSSNIEAFSWESLIHGFKNLTFADTKQKRIISVDGDLALELNENMSRLRLRS